MNRLEESEGMNSFLSCWLAEALRVLECEFAGKVELLPCDQLPEPEKMVSFSITLGGSDGRFLISAERDALNALFSSSGAIVDGQSQDSYLEVWRGILQQIAQPALRLFRSSANSIEVSVEPVVWAPGEKSLAYGLRVGDNIVPLSFTDEIKRVNHRRMLSPSATESSGFAPRGVDLLLEIELEASLRFGSREMSLNEVLDLGAGDVVELDRHVSDPVDLLVGDKIVARGEVVLINGSFGLRVLEVAEPKKRLESIRCLF